MITINGIFSEVDPLTDKYLLNTNEGSRYEIRKKDDVLFLYKESKELGRIVRDKSGWSGCVWMEKNGVVNEPVGEYEWVDGNFRVLGYENFAVKGSWQENIHPLDYLIQRVLEKEN